MMNWFLNFDRRNCFGSTGATPISHRFRNEFAFKWLSNGQCLIVSNGLSENGSHFETLLLHWSVTGILFDLFTISTTIRNYKKWSWFIWHPSWPSNLEVPSLFSITNFKLAICGFEAVLSQDSCGTIFAKQLSSWFLSSNHLKPNF